MKTGTRAQILNIISNHGRASPTELANTLRLSNQAIHRHLHDLIAEGHLERRSSPPTTYYVVAGVPEFARAIQWLNAKHIRENSIEDVCETRDVFAARVSKLSTLQKLGVKPQDLPLIISAIAEIGNNSFDHNLGQWRDTPGCWMEWQITGKKLWICVADRGQGIFQSLSRVAPHLKNDQEALDTAFTKTLSGRAPEQRGNGLKFVKNIILQTNNRCISCWSGNGHVHYGNPETVLEKFNRTLPKTILGTLTVISWGLK